RRNPLLLLLRRSRLWLDRVPSCRWPDRRSAGRMAPTTRSRTDMDHQRAFYEDGYARPGVDGPTVLREFEALPSSTRIERAAGLLAGCSGTFLDIGCGSGPLLHRVRAQFSRLIGVDISDAQLSQARAWSQSAGVSLDLHRYNLDVDEMPIEP